MFEEHPHIFCDLSLSRRLEKAEAQGNVDFVEARAEAFPESGACWMEVAGARAMFDGVESPLTQTFGLGLFETTTADDLKRLEEFFRERAAPVYHEVSPLAEQSLPTLLGERGYRPCELTSVMFRPLQRGATDAGRLNEKIAVRIVREDEHELWARTAARGWNEFAELADFMHGLSLVSAKRRNACAFLAELDGEPVATGALNICEGVALLAGASTIPEARQKGAQLALLAARLRYAVECGCDLAMMCAQPGGASQRNAERQGFRVAYTRIKWHLA